MNTRNALASSVFAIGAGALALLGWSGASLAAPAIPSTTYQQTSDHCTGLCGTSTGNTVTISDNVAGDNLLNVTVSLATGWFFQPPSGQGHEASFAFSSSISNLTFTGLTAGFTSFGGGTTTIHNDGLTHPASAYGFNADNNLTYSSLTFNIVTALGLDAFTATLLAAAGDASNPLFSADVLSPRTTGIIDFGASTPSTVPLPGALLLLGSALAGGAGFAGLRRRRQRVVA